MTLTTTTLKSFWEEQAPLLEMRLQELLAAKGLPYAPLFEAAAYSLFSGGKRIRPMLTLATCYTLGGNLEVAQTPAAALELIHTYSLIHDDLPCMDNDDLRRGRPTLHRVYPEWHALLTGDFLLTYAFEVLSSASQLSAEQRLALVASLSHHSVQMVGGQLLDLTLQNTHLEGLKQLHELKTGALITSAVEFGAIVAGASQESRALLTQFAKKIGLAFQVVDDLLDVVAPEHKGHGRNSDAANDKTTYVTLLGVEGCRQAAEQLLQEAKGCLDQLPYETALLQEIAELVVRR